MPRLVEKSFPPEFADQRDALLGVVRRGVSQRSAALERAAARLESEYPDAAVRARIKQQQTSRASRSGGSAAGSVGQSVTVNRVRAERLAWAMQDAVAAVQRQDHENPLGPHLKKGAREANAMFYIVLAGLVLDPDIEEWLGGITQMTRCPWNRAKEPTNRRGQVKPPRLTGYFDRGAVFGDWGHEALKLLRMACVILGWADAPQAADSAEHARPQSVPMRVMAVNRPTLDLGRGLPEQVKFVGAAFEHFYQVLDATTVPVEGGRRVDGVVHAVALCEATSLLDSELAATIAAVRAVHGVTQQGLPPGVRFAHADCPDGPWTEIPASDVQVRAIEIGGGGASAVLLAAMESAVRVTAYSNEKWNAQQAHRPGGPHQRWHAGDVVTNEDLARLANVQKMLALARVGTKASKPRKSPKKAISPLSEHQRMPDAPTVPVSLTKAAAWRGMSDWRAVKDSIRRGATKARQLSALRWELDLSQIQDWAREEATPRAPRAKPIPRE